MLLVNKHICIVHSCIHEYNAKNAYMNANNSYVL
nr:MAG TPA: MCSS domain [Inoviridae sp.]